MHFTCEFGWNNGVSIQHWYDAWAESMPQRIVRINGNYIELQSNAAFITLDDKYTGYESHYIHDVARFFEALNGGSLHPDYEFTLKPTSGYMLRAYSTRAMKKRESITRKEVTFHTFFPDISGSEIFIPQQETGTEYNDISRETTITPAQWKAKMDAGERFIYAEPKVAYDAENGIYELRVKKTPCK